MLDQQTRSPDRVSAKQASVAARAWAEAFRGRAERSQSSLDPILSPVRDSDFTREVSLALTNPSRSDQADPTIRCIATLPIPPFCAMSPDDYARGSRDRVEAALTAVRLDPAMLQPGNAAATLACLALTTIGDRVC